MCLRGPPHADIAFNSEPTHMDVCPTHRGGREAYLRFQGNAGMAYGGEESAGPVLALARAVVAIKEFNQARNHESVVPAVYRDEPALPFYLDQIGGGAQPTRRPWARPPRRTSISGPRHMRRRPARTSTALLDHIARSRRRSRHRRPAARVGANDPLPAGQLDAAEPSDAGRPTRGARESGDAQVPAPRSALRL